MAVNPKAHREMAGIIQAPEFKSSLDEYLETRSAVNFLSELPSHLQVSKLFSFVIFRLGFYCARFEVQRVIDDHRGIVRWYASYRCVAGEETKDFHSKRCAYALYGHLSEPGRIICAQKVGIYWHIKNSAN